MSVNVTVSGTGDPDVFDVGGVRMVTESHLNAMRLKWEADRERDFRDEVAATKAAARKFGVIHWGNARQVR